MAKELEYITCTCTACKHTGHLGRELLEEYLIPFFPAMIGKIYAQLKCKCVQKHLETGIWYAECIHYQPYAEKRREGCSWRYFPSPASVEGKALVAALRKAFAASPPSLRQVMTDSVINELVVFRPDSIATLKAVRGVGDKTTEKYGKRILEIMQTAGAYSSRSL